NDFAELLDAGEVGERAADLAAADQRYTVPSHRIPLGLLAIRIWPAFRPTEPLVTGNRSLWQDSVQSLQFVGGPACGALDSDPCRRWRIDLEQTAEGPSKTQRERRHRGENRNQRPYAVGLGSAAFRLFPRSWRYRAVGLRGPMRRHQSCPHFAQLPVRSRCV